MSNLLEWQSSKTREITGIGEYVEKLDPSYIAIGNISLYSHYRKQHDSAITFLSLYPEPGSSVL